MLFRILFAVVFIIFFDLYAYQTVRTLTRETKPVVQKVVRIGFFVVSISLYTLFFLSFTAYFSQSSRVVLVMIRGLFFALLMAKILMIIPLILEDVYRIIRKIGSFFVAEKPTTEEGSKGFLVSRKRFIAQVSAGIGGLTFAGLGYGIAKGAHHYKLHRQDIALDNLPPSFKGLRVGHLSDIHSGSFWDRRAVRRGVEKLMTEKPDVIFFTGDLVNNLADEMDEELVLIFSTVKAPMGVFSIFGNHDYGDYVNWADKRNDQFGGTKSDKSHMSPLQLANLEKLKQVHKKLGWDLLLNENRTLQIGDDRVAVIGIENYGARGRFPKYGDLAKAYKGTEEIPVKILLSHDPSHWDAQVDGKEQYKDIGLTLAGHTHGFQFGIESAWLKWSPAKYMYKHWAGLYTSGKQHLYVNRGFGYLGYPGRLGIRPEIGILTLV